MGIKQEDKNSALDGDDEQLNSILVNHYTHQDGSENRDHKHSFGEEISKDGFLNWLDLIIDLTIFFFAPSASQPKIQPIKT